MSVNEASKALGLSRTTVYSLIHRDDFPVVRLGGRTLINVKKLQEWVDNQTNE
jgi:excisionase family DNA binding protein